MINGVLAGAGFLIAARWAAQMWLERANQRHVLAHADAVPEPYKGRIDPDTYRKSVDYTLAKSRLEVVETSFSAVVLAAILFSGVLPKGFGWFQETLGGSAWAMAAFLFTVGVALSLTGLPFNWHAQFRLEERFGFNTTKPALWWMDQFKGLLLTLALGYPLLVLILKLVEWSGLNWWLWAWGTLMTFQLVMLFLAPVAILPLFNKFTPLPEGSLRERLLGLARKTRFHASKIQVMDGSRRSRHSNAFFTGFGKFRKIVLYDTLLQQLDERELEGVLAHEIGHYKKRHILRLLLVSALGLFVSFYALSVLARQDWFCSAFGFGTGSIVPTLLLFTLLCGTVTFWLSPLSNLLSRRFEYQADAFAAEAIGGGEPLVSALGRLTEKNLSNLTPHPLYSGFYYSHPTLVEREAALRMPAQA